MKLFIPASYIGAAFLVTMALAALGGCTTPPTGEPGALDGDDANENTEVTSTATKQQGEAAPPDASPSPADPQAGEPKAYDGQRFVVHEWGTLTSVVASDGRLLPGLHHEDEDLPGFVADRMAQAQVTPALVLQKMETPVTYFYSPMPRSVQVKVSFPQGLFTQWFPYVKATAPSLYLERPEDKTSIVDPWISSALALPPLCEDRVSATATGAFLDWGQVNVLAPGSAADLAGPLGPTTWGFARQTQANPVQVQVSGQTYTEKFLFYRGTGTFVLPLRVTAKQDRVVVTNTDTKAAMRSAFLLNVTSTAAGFAAMGHVAPAASVSAEIPTATLSHAQFSDELGQTLEAALVADGLYQDEARAMVATWRRSYFLTPGPRVLYLLPAAHTDALIPLNIVPAPEELKRTMVIRVEVSTPALEQQLDSALAQLAQPALHQAAKSALLAYGRFTEPYLTGALARATDPLAKKAGEALLRQVRAHRRWRPTAVE